MTKKREAAALIIGYVGSMLGLFGVLLFNQYILMTLPLWARMISMIVLYWLIALVPIVLIALNKKELSEYVFSEEKLGYQIAVGVLVGAAMSAVLTLLPHLLGFGEYSAAEKTTPNYGSSFMSSFTAYLRSEQPRSLYFVDSYTRKQWI